MYGCREVWRTKGYFVISGSVLHPAVAGGMFLLYISIGGGVFRYDPIKQ